MTLLLDTHAFLWFVDGHARLSLPARTAIENPSNRIFFSLASAWEIAIKISRGKLRLRDSLGDLLRRELPKNGFELLAVDLDHLGLIQDMPFHHADPFDRLLVAQAQLGGHSIVSCDSAFDLYGVCRVW